MLDLPALLSDGFPSLHGAAIALPLATVCGFILAFCTRRRQSPVRPHVMQTQILLAMVGALIMIVVGTSLVRAFAVVGAAGLVRYRAKVKNPKDAGVMLTTLSVGIACGVALYSLAIFATGFALVVLRLLDLIEDAVEEPSRSGPRAEPYSVAPLTQPALHRGFATELSYVQTATADAHPLPMQRDAFR